MRFVSERLGDKDDEVRRYRPDLMIDTGEADGLIEAVWEAAALEVGDWIIRVEARTLRCSKPGHAQAIDGICAGQDVVRAMVSTTFEHMLLHR